MWIILFRQRKLPKRFDESSSPIYHQTPKEMYRVICFEANDNVINGIKERFHQPDCEIYKQVFKSTNQDSLSIFKEIFIRRT